MFISIKLIRFFTIHYLYTYIYLPIFAPSILILFHFLSFIKNRVQKSLKGERSVCVKRLFAYLNPKML